MVIFHLTKQVSISSSSDSIISMQISQPQCPVQLPLMMKTVYNTYGYGALESVAHAAKEEIIKLFKFEFK